MSVKTIIRTDEYCFFYKGEFSQFYPSRFVIDGVWFNRCEQWMMWCKAMHFKDFRTANEIMKTNNPHEQKMLGRDVTPFDKEEWKRVCKPYVFKGNYAKYTQNERLGMMLKDTAGLLMVEASPTDEIWGIGLGLHDKRIFNRRLWRGLNFLGEVETNVRIAIFGI